MIAGTVKGSIWATKKDERLRGCKLMVVETSLGVVVADDGVGAGIGDRVLVCLGSSARMCRELPVDAAIVGIIDSLDGGGIL